MAGRSVFIDSWAFRGKSGALFEAIAMRDDLMDIDMYELETFGPSRIRVLPIGLKVKTTKTTR
jgi:hypothetical protein